MTEQLPDPAAPGTHGPRPGRGRTITVATLAALGLTAGGIAIAEAATASGAPSGGSSSSSASKPNPKNAPQPPAAPSKYDLDGTVTAVSSDAITVRSLDGTSRTYSISSSTTVHRGPTKSSTSALATGDRVGVRGAKSGSGYTAKDIDVRLAHIDGAVKSFSGNTLTVTDPDGFTRTVTVTSSTTYTKNGKSSSRSAISDGSLVHAEGKVDANGTTLDASHVDVGTKGAMMPGGPMGGPPAPPAGAPAPGANGKSGSGSGKNGGNKNGGKGAPPAAPKTGSGSSSGSHSAAPSGSSNSGS